MNRRQLLIAMFACGLSSTEVYSGLDVFFRQNFTKNKECKLDAMCVIGKWYLKSHPDEKNKDILLYALQKTIVKGIDSDQDVKYASMTELISKACNEDYARGDVVYIGGWQLAITEARLCGLRTLEALG